MTNGKGDSQRDVDRKKFEENFESIFKKKPTKKDIQEERWYVYRRQLLNAVKRRKEGKL